MAFEGSEAAQRGKKGQPPKRGQIKARIMGSLVRSVLTMASKRGGGRGGKGQSEGEEYSTSTVSPSSGYSSEAPSFTAAPGSTKQRMTAAAPTFFLSSTNSLDGFVVEVPKQVMCRYPAACRGIRD